MPEVSVAWTQSAAITAGHVLQADADPAPPAKGREPRTSIHVSVAYRLGEYVQLLREHATQVLLARERARGRDPGERLPRSARLTLECSLRLVGPVIFWRKKRRMPTCRFAIDDWGLVRETRDGTLRVSWDQVVAVHRHSGAWLVDKGDGGLPLPHRCFSDAQRIAFERLLRARFGDE